MCVMIRRRDLHRREHAPGFLRVPRQNLRGAIHVRIRQPALRRVHQLGGHQRALLARVDADVLAIAQEQERRQRAPRFDALRGATYCGMSQDVNRRETRRLPPPAGRCTRAPSWWCRDRCRCSCRRHALAHVELQLPAAPVARHAPQLQHAGFGHHGLERDRHHFSPRCRRPGAFTSMGDSSSSSSPKSSIIAPAAIVLAHRRAEEAELGRLADHQAEFAVRDALRRCLLPCRTAPPSAP